MTTDAASPAPATHGPPDSAGADLVPGWMQRLAAIAWRVLVSVALLLVVANFASRLSTVTGAILVGLIVTATVYPLVQQLRTRGWPRARAAVAVSVLALLVVVIAIVLIALAFIPYAADVVRFVRDGVGEVSSRLADLGAPEPILVVLNRAVDDMQSAVLASIGELVQPIASLVTILILGGFLTFYLLEDGDRAWASATKELDAWRVDQLTGRGLVALEQVGGYLRGTAVIAATDALTDWLFLTVLGVPLAGPLAVIVFVGGFVPYLGGIVSISILTLVTLATGGFLAAGILLALVVVTNVAQSRYLAPRAFGPMVKIPAALALVALPAGAALFGFLGLLVTVPVVVAVVAFVPAIKESLGRVREPEMSEGSLVPVWLDRLGQWSWRALVVLGLSWLVIQVAIVPFFSVPVVLALIVAAALSPVSNALRRRGASPTMAASGVTLASIAIVVVVVALTVVTISKQLPEIVDGAAIGAANLGLGVTPVNLVHFFGDGLIGSVTAVVGAFANTVLVLAISILLIFFFLRDGGDWWAHIVSRIPVSRRERVNWTGLQSAEILRGTMTGTALVSLAGAILQWFTMAILGLPLAFPIGVLTFFAGFIPYIGSLITTTLGFLVAVAVGEPIDIVLMFIFTIVFNIVQGNLVAPLVFGKTVSLHPAVVLLAAPAGAAIGGILGMVMVVPFLAIIARTWRTVIHLFDPEYAEPAAAAALPPAPPPEPPRRRRAAPATGGAEP